MNPLFKKAVAFLPELVARLTIRRDSGPIDSVDSVCSFVSTRAAFIAQKSLYGYLKARMGTRYPSMFEDDAMIASIDIAKINIYLACLSDLSVYAAIRSLQDVAADDKAYHDMALRCLKRGLADNAEQARNIEAFSVSDSLADFEKRLAFVDWYSDLPVRHLFTASPAALYKWAPIAPNLKREDKEIVENSIKFAWRDVRAQFEKRIDSSRVAADLSSFRPSGN